MRGVNPNDREVHFGNNLYNFTAGTQIVRAHFSKLVWTGRTMMKVFSVTISNEPSGNSPLPPAHDAMLLILFAHEPIEAVVF